MPEIKEQVIDMEDQIYHVFSNGNDWNCTFSADDDEEEALVVPLAFVVEFMHSSLWENKNPHWECHCGLVPLQKTETGMEEFIMDYGIIPINIQAINPQKKLPFTIKKDGTWRFVDDSLIEIAVAHAKDRACAVMGLIGCFLDARYNQLGQTNWDILSEWIGRSTFQGWLNDHVR